MTNKLSTIKFNEKIAALRNGCTFISSTKQAIDYVVLVTYDIVSNPNTQHKVRPNCQIEMRVSVVEQLSGFKTETQKHLLWEASFALIELYALAPAFTNVIELIYIEQYNDKLGQHMTPSDVARLCAALNLRSKSLDELRAMPEISIADPTGCGTGSMLLATIEYLHSLDPDLIEKVSLHGVDIDFNMAVTSIIQLELSTMLHGIRYKSLSISCANAITDYCDQSKIIYQVNTNAPAFEALQALMKTLNTNDSQYKKAA